MKRALIAALLALPLLAACNTIEGVGKDLQDGGRAMNKAINGESARDRSASN